MTYKINALLLVQLSDIICTVFQKSAQLFLLLYATTTSTTQTLIPPTTGSGRCITGFHTLVNLNKSLLPCILSDHVFILILSYHMTKLQKPMISHLVINICHFHFPNVFIPSPSFPEDHTQFRSMRISATCILCSCLLLTAQYSDP